MPEISDSTSSVELHGLRLRIKELNRQLHTRLFCVDGLLLFLTLLAILMLAGVVATAYAAGETGLAMLFLAVLIVASPFAVLTMGRAIVPLWRLATERARLHDQAEQVRGRLGMASRYSLPKPVNSPPVEVKRTQPQGIDPFTAG